MAASWFRRIGFVHSEPQADYVVRARIAACTIALGYELRLRDTYNFSSFSALFGQPPARSRTRRGAAMTAELANLDRQIAELRECKPLTETEVSTLCDKVTAAAPLGSSSVLRREA